MFFFAQWDSFCFPYSLFCYSPVIQCWYNVGTASATLPQHYINIGWGMYWLLGWQGGHIVGLVISGNPMWTHCPCVAENKTRHSGSDDVSWPCGRPHHHAQRAPEIIKRTQNIHTTTITYTIQSAVQGQKTVSAYFTSKQILQFDLAE